MCFKRNALWWIKQKIKDQEVKERRQKKYISKEDIRNCQHIFLEMFNENTKYEVQEKSKRKSEKFAFLWNRLSFHF